MKQKVVGQVISQKEIAPMIFDMWIDTTLAGEAQPGQFICVYPKDKSTLLPRPISICEVREDRKALRIVYRVAGAGTKEFSAYRAGESIAVMGPLGNGFPVKAGEAKKAFLIGGGIGVPPMLELAKQLERVGCQVQSVMGYRNQDTFLKLDLEQYGLCGVGGWQCRYQGKCDGCHP